MSTNINYTSLNSWIDSFCSFVESESGVPFHSFASNPYTEKEEGYKYKLYEEARKALGFAAWRQDDVGSGKIANAVIMAIELKGNNLFQWQAKYGEAKRPHQPLHIAVNEGTNLGELELTLYNFFHSWNELENMEALIGAFKKRYGLIAYLYFIKDRSQYLPIAPSIFDDSFTMLNIDFKTSHQCSWANYRQFLNHIDGIRRFLSDRLEVEVSLLDAHSFTYMLSRQMARANFAPNKENSLTITERDTISKSRIGQGQFRADLLAYWGSCAVTGCRVEKVLRASHLKPWANSNDNERLDPFNGLLLTPNLDTCLDRGFISFDQYGRIILSEQLNKENWKSLGINGDQKLIKLDSRHEIFLDYHRNEVFDTSWSNNGDLE
jgi:predicted restriction endonuclease